MYPYSYAGSLRIKHPTIDPKIITETLGLEPHITNRSGERRATPKGDLLEGHYDSSYWSHRFIPPDDSDIAEFLERTVETLKWYRSFFREIRNAEGKVEFYIGLFTDGTNIGATLDHELLKELGDLGIDLSLDIYGGKDEEDS